MANLKPGDQNILFSLPGVDNEFYSLSSYADKNAVVVIFTCNHCPYAQAWEGRFKQIQADYGPQGVQLIAINANDAVTHPGDSFEMMQQHAQEREFNFPYLHDEEQAVARAYGAERTPEVFVFDKAGILQYHGTVDDNADDPAAVQHTYLRDAIDAVLASQIPALAETAPKGCTIKWKQMA